MVGKTFTYLIGSDASALFLNSKNSDLNAEEVYSKLVTPVFGKGVAYDVPNKVGGMVRRGTDCHYMLIVMYINIIQVFMEQKKMLKTGLTLAHFRRYVPLIEKETSDYFERWGDSGRNGKLKYLFVRCVGHRDFSILIDLFKALSELIILTASRCLHGMCFIFAGAHINLTSVTVRRS